MTSEEPLAPCGNVLCVHLGERLGEHECEPYRPLTHQDLLARCGNVHCAYLGERVGDHECEPYRPDLDELDAAEETE